MITGDLVRMVNLLNSEIAILKGDIKVFQTTLQNILSLPSVDIDGQNVVSMDQIIKICENNFKYLSNKIEEKK